MVTPCDPSLLPVVMEIGVVRRIQYNIPGNGDCLNKGSLTVGKGVRRVPQFDYNIPGGSDPLESEGRNQVFKIRTYELGTYVLLDEGLPPQFYHPYSGRPH